MGNEKALAQMISHHSVIFQPLKRNFWVSTAPYQLGAYLNYNLTDFFSRKYKFPTTIISDSTYTISDDPFLSTDDFSNFMRYKEEKTKLINIIKNNVDADPYNINSFIALNPAYFESYVLAGDYYFVRENKDKALHFYTLSLSKEFEKEEQKQAVLDKIKDIRDE